MIKRVRFDGSFDIDYDDGEQETMVAKDLVRTKEKESGGSPSRRAPRLEEGMKVEGNYKSKGRWYPGRIKNVRGDGTFDIDYDDGEKETRVEAALIRTKDADDRAGSSPPRGGSAKIEVGDKVEGNFRGKGDALLRFAVFI